MIQLRVRTEYSFGETFAPIDQLVKSGCTAMGIVDNNTWGHVPFYQACKKAGIRPLLGVEVVVTDDDEFLPKMWFLARTTEGLSELYRFLGVSYSQTVKSHHGAVNRLYRDDIQKMSPDIIKFAGEVTDREFLTEIGAFADLNPSIQILNAKKRTLGLPLVSTSDNYYVNDVDTFELIGKLKVSPQSLLSELDYQDVAAEIAESCSGLVLPKAPMLKVEGDLLPLCRAGLADRFDWRYWDSEYEERLQYELNLIKTKDFESYFIIVADMVRFAKRHMLVGPSRGSAAGSLVCYLLGITEIDPIPAGLFFERFIDINRSDLPDIDLDFPDNKRQMVFDYMTEKYGNVAHIGTVSKYRPKSALIKICKILGIPASESSVVKHSIIERMPGDARYNKCLEDTFKAEKDFINTYPQAQAAARIEGHASHTGVHAAGLLVCTDDINNYAVVDAKGIAHVEKDAAEDLGLLKIDVLGLRTLTVLSELDIDWYSLKFDDPKVFEIFNSGKLCGIFQFEGRAMRKISSQMTFKTIEDISIAVALARPGPMMSGIDKQYIARRNGEEYDKELLPMLEETHGLPIYQEQTMAIVREIGKFSWEETIKVRKAIAKSKGREAVEAYREKFLERGDEKVWDMINEMGAYQMNKAHTFSYAAISYWTAYFKAHYPLEFTAASLRHAKTDDDAILLLREGVDYVPFDLEKSEANWSVKDGILYGGFTALRGVGEIKAAKFIESRDKLTEKQINFLAEAENVFENIFPMHANYQSFYDGPDDIAGEVVEIDSLNKDGDVLHGHERVFLAELTYKNNRSENEPVRIKKREGRELTGPMDYLNVRLRDDSGEIGGRVGRQDFQRIGKLPPVGSHLLIRAVFWNNIPYAFIQKWRRIDA